MIRWIYILLFIAPLYSLTAADEVEFTASAPGAVEVGEQFRLSYSLNANPSGFQAPAFDNFNVLSGPMTSSSSSVQIINGSVTQTVEFSYTYILQATREGKFTIAPARVTVGKKTYTSNAITIEVVKGRAPQQQQPQQQHSGSAAVQSGGQNLFVRVLLSKNSAYRGEAIVATVKIYSKVNLTNISRIEYPGFDGFYKEEIETPPLTTLVRENVDGEIYGTGVLQKFLLFPQRSGKIVISPAKLECIVRQVIQRQPRSIFDDFFGGSYQDVKVPVESPEVSVQVKDWPSNAPAGFNGATGHFDLDAKIDKTSVKANEAITLRISLIGNGNLKLIDKPEITFPPDFEVYDPEVKVNVKNSVAGAAGSKTFEYLIIPRHDGTFTIPSVTIPYFDLASKQFKTLQSQVFKINVEKAAESDAPTPVISGVSKEDLKYIGKDIRFIKTTGSRLKKPSRPVFASQWYGYSYVLLFLLFCLFVIYKRKQIRENANIALSRNKRANRKALKRLKTAGIRMREKQRESFYDEVIKALWGYLGDKLIIPQAGLSRDSVSKELAAYHVPDKLISQLQALLDECELSRYSPARDASEMESVYKKAIELIAELEQAIRKKK